MATVKKLSLATVGAMFAALSLGLEAAYAHGGHRHSEPNDSHSPSAPSTSSVDPRLTAGSVFYGEAQPLGNGMMRTFVTRDSDGNLSDIGITFTEAALTGLPKETDDFGEYPLKLKLLDGSPNHTFEYELPFPKEAPVPPFTHMSFNTNPFGHGPEGVYDSQHFDIHFSTISPEARHAIQGSLDDPEFLRKAYTPVPPEFLSEGYEVAAGTAEPRMGAHWADVTGPEFSGQTWDKSFLFGSYQGKMAFWEPMIATSFLKTKPNTTDPIKQPSAYFSDGYYPTAYSVNYTSGYADGEYSVSLNGLTFRSGNFSTASVPEPPSTLGLLVLGAFGLGSVLKRNRTKRKSASVGKKIPTLPFPVHISCTGKSTRN